MTLVLVAVAVPRDTFAQARGTMTVRAEVLSAAPGRAGIDGATELVKSWRPTLDSAARAETPLAVVTLRWEGRAPSPHHEDATPGSTESLVERPRLVASIQFLRN